MSVRVTLYPRIYDRESLAITAAAFASHCSVAAVGETTAGNIVEIAGAPEGGDETQVVREFLNYLLNLSIEAHFKQPQSPINV